MPPSVSLQEAQRHVVNFGTTREREFFRYLPPLAHPLQHITRDTSSSGLAPHSSPDASLSAFAQLGALRIGAQRVLISLFGRHEEHIIAEATQTMSLRFEKNQQPQDDLLFGVCTLSYSRSLSLAIANSPPAPAQPPVSPVLIVPDLTQDDVYQHHPDVTGFPNLRFLASAPIVSPKGTVIGAYTVLDDKPRKSVCPGLLDFLTDMAAIVINYLDYVRCQAQHLRAERMVVGLGSFLEGKGGLRSLWLDETEAAVSTHHESEVEGSINTNQQDKQRVDGIAAAMRSNKNSSTVLPLRHDKLHALGVQADKSRERPVPKINISRPVRQPPNSRGPFEKTTHVGREETRFQSNKEAFSTQVEDTFARAANIIRESLEVEAAMFFDPKFGGQGAFVTNSKSDVESGLESSSADEEMNATKSETQSKLPHSVMEDSGKTTLNPSKILGFATSNAASVNGESKGDPNIALSQTFLAGLLRRYPRGKIFNFGEDGSISSNDSSDSVFKDFNVHVGKRYKKTRKSVLRQDALTLLNLAPDSRSIIFSPIWDTHKSRWYAATLAWTRVPQRIFTIEGELTFCMAFGNSLMAEVHRLGALFTDRATADLLAGLSHELRSPLHGITGIAELLNDTAMDAIQRDFVHTIISCANTLLGSIDHLLEYSSVNDLQEVCGVKYPPSHQPLRDGRHISQTVQADPASIVSLDVAMEETIETVNAGFNFLRETYLSTQGLSAIEQDQQKSVTLPSSVKLIFDIDSSPSWRFATRPGAWNAILTNIVGNALKYTQQGYVYVSAKVKPVRPRVDRDTPRSTVTIYVQDTGCGMDAEFLQDGYFTAFSQENDTVPGNGLGANITKRTISSLGGEFKVCSQRGTGTEITISVTLDHVSDHYLTEHSLDNYPTDDYLAPTRRLVSQKTIGILGLDNSQLGKTISSSLQKVCEEWLQMNVRVVAPSSTELPRCDFYIAPHEFLDTGNLEIRRIIFDSNLLASPPVIVICSSPRLARSLFVASRERGDSEVLEFITQPCGPRKLAKSLETCLKRQERRVAGVTTPGPSMPSPFRDSNRQLAFPSNDNLSTHLETNSSGHVMANSRQGRLEPRGRAKSLPVDKDYFSFHSSPPISTSPLSPPPETDPTPTGKIDSHTATERDSILFLLVDDNPINLSLLVAFVKKLGLDYITAQNGQEALDSFKKYSHRVRIVLMDISMPMMDGLESTRQIRAFENTLKQPSRAIIVALTGVAQADVQRDAMASGMDLFLTKPVRLNVISQIIHDYTE